MSGQGLRARAPVPLGAVVVRWPASYAPERKYIAGVVLERFLGLPHRLETADTRSVQLSLEQRPDGPCLELPDLLFSTAESDWLTPRSLPDPPLPRWDAGAEFPELRGTEPLPVLLSEGGGSVPMCRPTPGGIRLDLDVFGSAFLLLTRAEEIANPERDEHGRFRFTSAIAYRDGFLHRPLVDEYVEVLELALRRLWPDLPERSRSARVLVTHDMDFPAAARRGRLPTLRSAAADLLKRRDPRLAARRLRSLSDRGRRPERDPAFTFDFLLAENERHGVRCVLNVMSDAGGFGSVPYSLDEPWARALLRRVAAGGHQLGLHPSYGSHLDGPMLQNQFERLRAAAEREGIEQQQWGGRQHWLCWENPITWRLWDEAGLAYDSSLGYDQVAGFRASVCRPYPAFDLIEHRPLELEERPLAWMDVTYMDYLGMRPHQAVERAVDLHAVCRRHGGELTILWHNDLLASAEQRAAYRVLLERLA